jgi:RNA polymerase sigma-70 factor (ECF subfamily)
MRSLASGRSTPRKAEAAPADTTDDALFASYRAGIVEDFDVLYARYKDKTWRYFLRQVNEEQARDCQQELWMKVIERADRYRAEGRFGAYLFSVAHSTLMDNHRKNLRLVRDEDLTSSSPDSNLDAGPVAPAASEPIVAASLQQRLARLADALRQLPIAQRSVFVMRAEAGMSHADIAVATDSDPEAVKSRLRYAKAKLREELSDAND